MLIAMAGLPATGKSTLAKALAEKLPAVLLDKDAVRTALFQPEDIAYASDQDDLCVNVMFMVAAYHVQKNPARHVIFDGRTFSKKYQIDDLVRFAHRVKLPLRVIECITTDEIAETRLAEDQQAHLAANRDLGLYRRLKAEADPIELPKLVIDTSRVDIEASVADALAYLLANQAAN